MLDFSIFAAPSGPPTRIVIVDISSSSFIITWERVLCKRRGGNNRYHYELTSEEDSMMFSMETSDLLAVILPLTPCTSYSFRVRAFNQAGYGIFSPPIVITTDYIGPGKFLIILVPP